MRNVIFQIDGGLGKNILATAVCEAIKQKYPDDRLIVVSAYPDVFLNNPNISRALNISNVKYFYQDYVQDTDSVFLLHNPYMETDYVYERKHLIEIWCDMFDLPYSDSLKPVVELTQREKDFYQKKYATDKPILLIQPNGGFNQDLKYAWSRDLPYRTVTEVVEQFKHTHSILHIKREDQVGYADTFQISSPFREVLALMQLSERRLFIDSFCQHAAAAMDLPSTVCWIGTSPKVFGYDVHDNITANTETKPAELKDAYINKYNIGGNPLEFPYNSEDEIFDVDRIVESLKK